MDPTTFAWTLAYVGLGLVTLLLSVLVLSKVLPFSLRKEIEEDHNTALAIVIGAGLLGICHIIAAAIH